MRVIKFRAWDNTPADIGGQVMLSWDKIQELSEHEILLDAILEREHESLIPMQFTGLTDANGVEIYESDIVEDHNGIGIVKYSERYAGFRVSYGDGTAKWFYDYNLRGERESIVVIGNFHQDQGLLEYDYV